MKEGNPPKPLPSFSFLRPPSPLLPTTIYINKSQTIADVSVLFQHPSQSCNTTEKNQKQKSLYVERSLSW